MLDADDGIGFFGALLWAVPLGSVLWVGLYVLAAWALR